MLLIYSLCNKDHFFYNPDRETWLRYKHIKKKTLCRLVCVAVCDVWSCSVCSYSVATGSTAVAGSGAMDYLDQLDVDVNGIVDICELMQDPNFRQ